MDYVCYMYVENGKCTTYYIHYISIGVDRIFFIVYKHKVFYVEKVAATM